jgi:hypothetical protein
MVRCATHPLEVLVEAELIKKPSAADPEGMYHYLLRVEALLNAALAAELPARSPKWQAALLKVCEILPNVKSKACCLALGPLLALIQQSDATDQARLNVISNDLQKSLAGAMPEEVEKESDAIARAFTVLFSGVGDALTIQSYSAIELAVPVLSRLQAALTGKACQAKRVSLQNKLSLMTAFRDAVTFLQGKLLGNEGEYTLADLDADSIAALCAHKAAIKALSHEWADVGAYSALHDLIECGTKAQAGKLVVANKAVVESIFQASYCVSTDESDVSLRSILRGVKDGDWTTDLRKGKDAVRRVGRTCRCNNFQDASDPFHCEARRS